MRNLAFLTAISMSAVLCSPANATTTFSATQYAQAAAGLDAMKKLNLLTTGDATLHSDVEGKLYVGGNLTGNSATVGKGGSGSFKADSGYKTVTVGGNLTGGLNVNNGIGLGSVEVVVGGDAQGVNLNVNGNVTGTVTAGGAVTNFNGASNKTATSGTSATNSQQHITNDVQLAAHGALDVKASVANTTAEYQQDLTTLSQVLDALTPDATLAGDQNSLHFDFTNTPAGSAYAVVDITGSQLSSGTFTLPTFAANETVIVNVSGTTANIGANMTGNGAAVDQNIIWNFTDATTVNVNTALYGSVLAPEATIQGNSPINGSVAAKMFDSNGEVHLGTFNGTSGFLVTSPPDGSAPGVPEPASWMTMLAGFGMIGSLIRTRRRKERSAAA